MAFENLDVVKVELDMYANGNLVQTTDEKKAKESGLEGQEFGPQNFIVGKKIIVEALDEDLLKAEVGESRNLKLSAEEAFGKRKKEFIKTFPKKVFDEQNIRAVPGATYDFNGMYGTIKSVVGGRVMVDFNNPLAGKEIEINYKVNEKVEDMNEILSYIIHKVYKLPQDKISFEVEGEDKITLYTPKEIISMKDQLISMLKESLKNADKYTIDVKEKKEK